MSQSLHMQSHSARYFCNNGGSIVESLEGLTYDPEIHQQISASFYKARRSDPGSIAHYSQGHIYGLEDHQLRSGENARPINSLTTTNSRNRQISAELEAVSNTVIPEYPLDSSVRPSSRRDYPAIWEGGINPDNMTYEQLLELGERIGNASRGLSQDLISKLPVSKYKSGFLSRMKLRKKRQMCVICQTEYKRKDQQITLPCKHVYHLDCGTKWLGIKKTCPICYAEVFGDASNQ